MKINTIEAIFVREDKHRFLGIINIDGEEYDCYVPSSSKLKNYLDVNNRPALVIPMENEKNRIKYRLIAICVEDEWVVVDLNILNRVLKEKYEIEGYFVKQEQKVINGYRTDLVIENNDLLRMVEIKGLISLDIEVLAPLNCGERANRQLVSINNILSEKIYTVEYAFVVLSNHIKKIIINNDHNEFKKNFMECVRNGMEIKTYRINLLKNEIMIFEDSDIIVEI